MFVQQTESLQERPKIECVMTKFFCPLPQLVFIALPVPSDTAKNNQQLNSLLGKFTPRVLNVRCQRKNAGDLIGPSRPIEKRRPTP